MHRSGTVSSSQQQLVVDPIATRSRRIAAGDVDDLLGNRATLHLVRIQQSRPCIPTDDGGQLPRQIIGVTDSRGLGRVDDADADDDHGEDRAGD